VGRLLSLPNAPELALAPFDRANANKTRKVLHITLSFLQDAVKSLATSLQGQTGKPKRRGFRLRSRPALRHADPTLERAVQ
jgi:hypothetical protein